MLGSIAVRLSSSQTRLTAGIAAFLLTPALSLAAGRGPRVGRVPLVPGESLRYLIEYQSRIESQSTSPIYTASQAHRLDINFDARIRLDVLSAKDVPAQGSWTRLRVTYETCDANTRSDAYDPVAENLAKQYRNLRGRSFEFTIDGHGRVEDIAGLDGLEPDESARNAIRDWLSNITLPLGLWKPGTKPGKKWSREVPLAGAPLEGLAWRTQSAYRNDEVCPAPPAGTATAPAGTCAVISTRLETVRNGSGAGSTPLAYQRHGLETSGHWNTSGESLSYVSLSSGLVVSATATENDTIDLHIASTLSGSRLHYAAREQSSSQIALLSTRESTPGGKQVARPGTGSK